MFYTLKMELQKAFKNKFFYIAIIIGCIIVTISTVHFIRIDKAEIEMVSGFERKFGIKYNTSQDIATPFGRWIGSESFSLGASIYYFIFPLMVAIPYGWSYSREKRSGYEKNVLIRSGKRSYYISKYIALFTSGGITMIIPLVFQFFSLAMFFPLVAPNVSNTIYYGIFPKHLMSALFYNQPCLYVLGILLLNFIICGFIACFCYTSALFIKNAVAVTISPFLLLLVLRYGEQLLSSSVNEKYQLNPMSFLRGSTSNITLPIILIEILVLCLFTFVPIMIRGRNNEIY